jgi:transcriptional regulator with XRE-family HTH domain
MGTTRIGPRKPRRLYLAEWRESRGLTQKQLADRLGVSDMTISRWETGRNRMTDQVMDAVAEALDMDADDLRHDPNRPSADALLRDQPEAIRDQAFRIIEAIIGRKTGS